MFEEWTASTWLILLVDIIAIVIVVMFLKRKIQHKLHEVEARQAHQRLQRKRTQATVNDETPAENES
tara:strand:- start:410 stop:610 length:201 start_codon:yes stop_codon:yes gene_type:complete